jgi:pyruvate/2-oxoglutarate dehydrogenase complex dihydrolipoamide acyltransferase (E2) component
MDVGGAHATVTNVDATGTPSALPRVVPGEASLLAPGAIVDGTCRLTLCYDRARYDEHRAEQLLARVVESLVHANSQGQ